MEIKSLHTPDVCLKDDICQIIFEGEPTEIGRRITIARIKDLVDYDDWLNRTELSPLSTNKLNYAENFEVLRCGDCESFTGRGCGINDDVTVDEDTELCPALKRMLDIE